MKDQALAYWLALLRVPGIGPINFMRLIQHFGDPPQILAAGNAEWQRIGLTEKLRRHLQQPDWAGVDKDLQWIENSHCQVITLNEEIYPPLLRKIHDPPPLLFILGNPQLLSSLQLAIVGTRSPSAYGQKIAHEFSKYLSSAGFTITSGLALGIDAASHWGTFAGNGKTIAVAGTGLDRVYPAQHRELAHKIAKEGALISEFLPGTPANKENFPRRNRIISGLSLGTLIVEASLHSGALYTAQQALEQGREIFAIPGSIHNPLVKGCHKLIKEGAKLVESASDIAEELFTHLPKLGANSHLWTSLQSPLKQPTLLAKPAPATNSNDSEPLLLTIAPDNNLEPEYTQLLSLLCNGPISIDHLVEQSGFRVEVISSMLLVLELQGKVTTQTGGLYLLTD